MKKSIHSRAVPHQAWHRVLAKGGKCLRGCLHTRCSDQASSVRTCCCRIIPRARQVLICATECVTSTSTESRLVQVQGGDLLDWTSDHGIQEEAFIQRIEALSTMGYSVLLSNYRRYFKVANYLATFTRESIVIALGLPGLVVGTHLLSSGLNSMDLQAEGVYDTRCACGD